VFIFTKRNIKNLRVDGLFFIPILALLAQAVAASLLNLRSPFWLDEVATGEYACQPTYIDVFNMIAGDVHPPLFVLWVHTIFDLFGCNLNFVRISNAIALIGSGSIYCLLLRRRFGVLAALLFAALFFGSPTVWHYAYEARAYALLAAATIFVLYAAINNAWNLGLAASTIGSSLHYFGAYLFIVQVLMFFLLHGRITTFHLIKMVIALVLVSLQYAYSLPLAVTSMTSNDSWFLPALTWLDLLIILPAYLLGGLSIVLPPFLLGGLSQYVLVIAAFLTLPMVFKFLDQFEKRLIVGCLLMFTLFVIAVFLISYHKPMFVPRYMFFLAPLLFTGISVFLPKIAVNYFASENSPYRSMQLLVSLITIYICFGLATTLKDGKKYRLLHWNDAAKTSICSQNICGFVLDDPVIPYATLTQYNALANFLLRANGKREISWVAILPRDLENWISNNRSTPFVYVQSSRPALNIKELSNAFSLSCTTVVTQPAAFVCQKR